MKEIVKTTSDHDKATEEVKVLFHGYTLEELRYQRALVSLKKDFAQTKLFRSIETLQKTNPLSSENKAASLPGKVGFVASKLFSGLNYLDYAMMGFSLFSSARKIYGFFRKKK